jgi:ABC transport system ATP-binding/permease protein
MSEPLLKAILQLFAYLTRIDGVSEKEEAQLQRMLTRRLNRQDVARYMEVFRRYSDDGERAERVAEPMQPIRELCLRINRELTLQQKMVLLVELVQILFADRHLSKRENLAVRQIAHELKISDGLDSLISFVIAPESRDLNHADMLVIDGRNGGRSGRCRYLHQPGMEGEVAVLYIRSTNAFFLRGFHTSTLYLNQIPLEPGAIEAFPPGSSLRGERISTLYHSDVLAQFREDSGAERVVFQASDLGYRFRDGASALHNICLSETGGRLVGIMGGSGSGKTTLLNVLNGTLQPTSGKVLINGTDIHRGATHPAGLMGHVPQDDLLVEDLTAFDNLLFAAKLCFGGHPGEYLEGLVRNTLSSLGLEEVAHLRVGNVLDPTLSGGQRKRLNIALELLREPQVLFLDEPTSGLSSRDSENVMDLLKELALKGKLVFTVIHQPSSDIFKLFDSLLILDTGGYPVYYGNPVEAVVWFKRAAHLLERHAGACPECGNVNPEQIFSILEARVVDEYGRITSQRKVNPQTWHELYLEKGPAAPVPVMPEPMRPLMRLPGQWRQFSVFLMRDLKAKLHNRQYLLINLLEAPLLALLLAILLRFYQGEALVESVYVFRENPNVPAYIFMSVIVALFMGLVVSAEEILRDRKILRRERFLNLSRLSYLLSKIAILFALSAVQTLLYVWLANMILEVRGMTPAYATVLFSASCLANMLGLNISSAFDSPVIVYILIPLLLIPQIVLGGAVVEFDHLNPVFRAHNRVPLVGDLMPSRWAFEALMVSQYKDNPFQRKFYDLEREEMQSDFKAVYYIPHLQDILEQAMQLRSEGNVALASARTQLLSAEIERELRAVGDDKFPGIGQLRSARIDSALYGSAAGFLENLRRMYLNRNRQARRQREALVARLTESPADMRAFQRSKNGYTNDQVSIHVLQKRELNRLLAYRDRIEQNVYPVFQMPEPRHLLDWRAHFYAPKKHFAGKYYDTLWFNTAVLWLFSAALFILLYFDAIRRLINIIPVKKRSGGLRAH